MRKQNVVTTVYLCIFLIAALLRLYPAWLNRDANDDHFRVIEIIAYEHRIPDKDEFDCLQCYHPKLFHFAAAELVRFFHADPGNELKIISQMLSVMAGISTLVVGYLFLKRLPLPENVRIFSFLLLALHPALLTINIQATNDSFVIFFSSLALYSLFLFLENNSLQAFSFMLLSAILASISKGSGLIIFLGISMILMIDFLMGHKEAKANIRYLALIGTFIIMSMTGIILFGPYDEYFFAYGSPLVINKEKSPLPRFFEKTYVGGKTGIVSIFDGYFTFHPIDLIHSPYLDRESPEGEYSRSRTSLFTQLYARTVFIQYEGRPRDWFTKLSNPVYDLGKAIFAVALVPLLIFIFGLYHDTKKRMHQLLSESLPTLIADTTWIFSFFFWGFIAFIIKFTLEYREFSAMKPIYIYPALLSFLYIFALGLKHVQEKIKNRYVLSGISASLLVLTMLFILDVGFLIQKLS